MVPSGDKPDPNEDNPVARSKKTPPASKPPANPWMRLNWSDVGRSFDAGAIRRGRDYQAQGRVTDLRTAEAGRAVLATVRGGDAYPVLVRLSGGLGGGENDEAELTSTCTCFVGFACKHGVAALTEYLQALADDRVVPEAAPNDPRWGELAAEGDEVAGPADDADGSDPSEEEQTDGERLLPTRPLRPSQRSATPKPTGDRALEDYVRGRSAADLADLLLTLAGRVPAVAAEIREQAALAQGDGRLLLREAKQIIRGMKSEQSEIEREWSTVPPFGRIADLFEKLLTLNLADDVVSLGREYLPLGIRRAVEAIDAEDDTLAFTESLPVIFRAINQSSLTGSERLLFAIDALLGDDYDLVGEAASLTLDAPSRPEDWSRVADILRGRLDLERSGHLDDPTTTDARLRLIRWLDRALASAGRVDERIALAESEAETSGSFEPVVDLLLTLGRPDDAEAWATRGLAATVTARPGVARQLAGRLRQLAEARHDWPTVAAYRAWAFWAEPSRATGEALLADARRAGVEEPVRRLAYQFLGTGRAPVRWEVGTEVASAAASKTKGRGQAARGRGAAAPPAEARDTSEEPTLVVDPDWPLPVPAGVSLLLPRPGPTDAPPRPRFDVLVDWAIARNQPEEVIRWWNRAEAEAATGRADSRRIDPDRVASAVAASHPELAAALYRNSLQWVLPKADPAAYEMVVEYLRRLRPIDEALGRLDEWTALVAAIRAEHRNRPRLLEAIDQLDGQSIVAEAKKRSGRR